jgi:hypothetical protein
MSADSCGAILVICVFSTAARLQSDRRQPLTPSHIISLGAEAVV